MITSNNAELTLARTIEELLLNFEDSKTKGEDALLQAIRMLDDHIERHQGASKVPLWVEICQRHQLPESEWGTILANVFRTIAARCQVIEVTDWLEAEADLAEHQHE